LKNCAHTGNVQRKRLGLDLVMKSVVDAHGGRIKVERLQEERRFTLEFHGLSGKGLTIKV
jgi:hypothetical protein